MDDSKIGLLLSFLLVALLSCAAAERLVATGLIAASSSEHKPSVLPRQLK